jgi:hypothetical protein
MRDGKKVSEFPGRRPDQAAPAQDQPAPTPEHPGDFLRNPCGECWHFKREPRAGLDVGFCMFGPPISFPVPGPDGRPVGNMLVRTTVTAKTEGCDQWDDECEIIEGDGEPGKPAQLRAVGGGGA